NGIRIVTRIAGGDLDLVITGRGADRAPEIASRALGTSTTERGRGLDRPRRAASAVDGALPSTGMSPRPGSSTFLLCSTKLCKVGFTERLSFSLLVFRQFSNSNFLFQRLAKFRRTSWLTLHRRQYLSSGQQSPDRPDGFTLATFPSV
ncbi:unnamed protein product, partial [Nesidiocoris tenuis]